MNLENLTAGARVGAYTVLERLGHGGMGVVYKARDERLGRVVALKVVSRALAADPKARDRLGREARAAAGLAHPGIVSIFEMGEERGWPWLALELVPGGSLKAHLRARGRLDWREAATTAAELADALAAIHAAGLVHRDVKPENVLLDAAGRAKLSDFGVVRVQSESRLTATGEMLGTAAYMAPEQADGAHTLDGGADVYAIGCVLHELLTGAPPFAGQGYEVIKRHLIETPAPPSKHAADVPPALDALVLTLLAKTPAERPPASAVASSLRALLATPPAAPAAPRGARAAIVAATIVIAVAAVGAAGWLATRPAAPAVTTATSERPPPASTEPAPATTEPTAPPEPPARARLVPLEQVQGDLARAIGGYRFDPPRSTSPLRLLAAGGRTAFTHEDSVRGVALLSGGDVLAVDMRGWLRRWTPTGEEVWADRISERPLYALQVDEASQVALIGAADKLVCWDLESRRPRWTAPGEAAVYLALDATGARAIVGRGRGMVEVWNVERGALVAELQPQTPGDDAHELRPLCVALSAGGDVAAAGMLDGRVRLWQLGPDGRTIGAPIELTGVVEPHGTGAYRGDGGVRSLGFSRDGRRLLVGGGQLDPRARVVDVDSREPVGRSLDGHGHNVMHVSFLPDGRALTVDFQRSLRLWDLATGACLKTLTEHRDRVYAAAVDRERLRAVSGGADDRVVHWDLAAAAPSTASGRATIGVFAAADADVLVAVGRDGVFERWDLATGRCDAVFTHPTSPGLAGHAASDGGSLTFGAHDGVYQFDGWTTPPVHLPGPAAQAVTRLPDGRLLLGNRGAVREAGVEAPLFSVAGSAYAFASHGDVLLVGDDQGAALWRLGARGEPAERLRWLPVGFVYSVTAVDRGRYLLATRDQAWLFDPVMPGDPMPLAGGGWFVAGRPTSGLAATGSPKGAMQGAVLLWDLRGPRPALLARVDLQPGSDHAWCAAFTRDGDLAVGTQRGALLRFAVDAPPR